MTFDWTVPRPAPAVAPIDWDEPRPEPAPIPDLIEAPWGQVFRRCPDGYFRVASQDKPLAAGAVYDRIDRFLHWWTVLAVPGRATVCYRVVGPRIVVLWPRPGGLYRSGHLAAYAGLDAVKLTDDVPFAQAVRAAHIYWTARDNPRPWRIGADEVAARLRPRDDR